jgi:hypothetical protein
MPGILSVITKEEELQIEEQLSLKILQCISVTL